MSRRFYGWVAFGYVLVCLGVFAFLTWTHVFRGTVLYRFTCITESYGYPIWFDRQTIEDRYGVPIERLHFVYGWNLMLAVMIAVLPAALVVMPIFGAFRRIRLLRTSWRWLGTLAAAALVVRMAVQYFRPASSIFQVTLKSTDSSVLPVVAEAALWVVGLAVSALVIEAWMRWQVRQAVRAALLGDHDWPHDTPGRWDGGGD